MTGFVCCPGAEWRHTADLGNAASIEVDLGECSVCGRAWAHLYVVANQNTSYAPMDPPALQTIRDEADPRKRKQALRDWLEAEE